MKENVIEINSANYDAAYAMADEQTRKVLAVLCGRSDETTAPAKPAPTLSDYTTIRSYEDACEALGIEPNFNRDKLVFAEEDLEDLERVPKHIIALMKLETISYALWGRDFQPQPDGEGSKVYWFPWFALYSQDEINNMDDERRGALLAAGATYGADAGFGYLGTPTRSSSATANIGFRLCQETEEKAEYFGKQFIQLWADYLAFNFTVGDPLK